MKIHNNNNNLTDIDEPIPATNSRARWTESSSDWDTPPKNSVVASDPAPVALQADGIQHSFGTNRAVKDLSLTLHAGDTLGLLGLNGAGKTTLIKILAGALAPDRGTVHIGEQELYQQPIAARLQIGYAPDTPAVYPEFRVIEFLRFIARMRHIPKADIKTRIDDVLQRCHLEDVRRRVIGNLSSGYQQRVNLAQAMIHQPAVLILDEPTNGLDPQQMLQMRELVGNMQSAQATIFSSHQLSEVQSVCNRVMVVGQGQALLDANLAQLNGESFIIDITNPQALDLQSLPGVAVASKINDQTWIATGQSLTAKHIATMLESRGITVHSINTSNNFIEALMSHITPNEQRGRSS